MPQKTETRRPERSQPEASAPRISTDFTESAALVIEAWTARRRPEESDYRWVTRTPSTDWQYQANFWVGEMSEIQADFEDRIGFTIGFSPAEKRKTVGYKMMKNYFILVRKAETHSPKGRTILRTLAR